MQRPDYIQMAVIFLVIVAWDFVAGVAIGIVAACITFAINTSRLRLVRLGLNRTVYSGRVDRPPFTSRNNSCGTAIASRSCGCTASCSSAAPIACCCKSRRS